MFLLSPVLHRLPLLVSFHIAFPWDCELAQSISTLVTCPSRQSTKSGSWLATAMCIGKTRALLISATTFHPSEGDKTVTMVCAILPAFPPCLTNFNPFFLLAFFARPVPSQLFPLGPSTFGCDAKCTFSMPDHNFRGCVQVLLSRHTAHVLEFLNFHFTRFVRVGSTSYIEQSRKQEANPQ